MNRVNNKAIGIIGGMGPQASIYLHSLIIEMSIKHFNAKQAHEFPEIIHYSIPNFDFISSYKNKKKTLSILTNRIRKLSFLDISCLSIACNTAHILLPELQKQTHIPFISMIKEVIDVILKSERKKIGLLASPSTIRFKLYEDELLKHNIYTVIPTPDEQKILDSIIRNVLAGKIKKNDQKKLQLIADELIRNGSEGIILGCTELPIIFPKKYKIPLYNSVEILSSALLNIFYAGGIQ